MKKTQRARLAELTAKAEADRTAVEKAEFVYLAQLATLHPDAAKDIDDTSPAGAGPAAVPPTAAPSPAAGANAPPAGTLAAFVGAAVASLRSKAAVGADLTAARQSVATLTGERDQARQQVAALNSQLSALNAQLSAFATVFGITAAELAGKPAAEVTALIQTKISGQVIEHVASLGLPVGELPKDPKGDGVAGTFAEKLAAFNAMPAGKEKDAYYNREIAAEFAPKK